MSSRGKLRSFSEGGGVASLFGLNGYVPPIRIIVFKESPVKMTVNNFVFKTS